MDPLGLKKLNTSIKEEVKGVKEDELLLKIKELEKENKNLRSRLWNIEYRGSFPLSMILISIGGLSLLLAYAYESLVLTFIGLGLVLWGSVIFYALPKRFISDKNLFESISMLRALSSVIQNLGYKGKAVFLYPNTLEGLSNGYLFIPINDTKLPDEDEINKGNFMLRDGLLIPAHSQSIVKLLEDELNTNLLMLELAEMHSKVEEFFIEDLRIVDSINFDVKGNIVSVTIDGTNAAEICRRVNSFDTNSIGCPLCSSIALMLSKVTNTPVIIDETRVGSERIKTRYRLFENGT